MKTFARLVPFILLLTNGIYANLPVQLSIQEENFEALWKTFHERYAFFKLRGVDWQAQYKTYRPKITKDTSDDELFKVMCEMLKPLLALQVFQPLRVERM